MEYNAIHKMLSSHNPEPETTVRETINKLYEWIFRYIFKLTF